MGDNMVIRRGNAHLSFQGMPGTEVTLLSHGRLYGWFRESILLHFIGLCANCCETVCGRLGVSNGGDGLRLCVAAVIARWDRSQKIRGGEQAAVPHELIDRIRIDFLTRLWPTGCSLLSICHAPPGVVELCYWRKAWSCNDEAFWWCSGSISVIVQLFAGNVGDRDRNRLPILAVAKSSVLSISHKAKATMTNGCSFWDIKQEVELFALSK
ncbi:unnamed protein product [Ostreobium quekettii]|uniref:Uncharacterized protein n=1 Tax=Ostreobium quekettii TaxID=121088 RepID=A0A8S1IJX6_9CHLO|nr:unnamed protein product [Ostreobium quekettii]